MGLVEECRPEQYPQTTAHRMRLKSSRWRINVC